MNYLKIIKTFFQKWCKHPAANCLKKRLTALKFSTPILELLINTLFCMFWSNLKNCLAYQNFNVIWVSSPSSQTICFTIIILFFKKVLIYLKHAQFRFGCSSPLRVRLRTKPGHVDMLPMPVLHGCDQTIINFVNNPTSCATPSSVTFEF